MQLLPSLLALLLLSAGGARAQTATTGASTGVSTGASTGASTGVSTGLSTGAAVSLTTGASGPSIPAGGNLSPSNQTLFCQSCTGASNTWCVTDEGCTSSTCSSSNLGAITAINDCLCLNYSGAVDVATCADCVNFNSGAICEFDNDYRNASRGGVPALQGRCVPQSVSNSFSTSNFTWVNNPVLCAAPPPACATLDGQCTGCTGRSDCSFCVGAGTAATQGVCVDSSTTTGGLPCPANFAELSSAQCPTAAPPPPEEVSESTGGTIRGNISDPCCNPVHITLMAVGGLIICLSAGMTAFRKYKYGEVFGCECD